MIHAIREFFRKRTPKDLPQKEASEDLKQALKKNADASQAFRRTITDGAALEGAVNEITAGFQHGSRS